METALETINLGSLFSHFMAETILILAIPAILFVDLKVGKGKRDEWAAKIGLLALCAAFFLALIQDTTSAGFGRRAGLTGRGPTCLEKG